MRARSAEPVAPASGAGDHRGGLTRGIVQPALDRDRGSRRLLAGRAFADRRSIAPARRLVAVDASFPRPAAPTDGPDGLTPPGLVHGGGAPPASLAPRLTTQEPQASVTGIMARRIPAR
jgi:hypothetical protein